MKEEVTWRDRFERELRDALLPFAHYRLDQATRAQMAKVIADIYCLVDKNSIERLAEAGKQLKRLFGDGEDEKEDWRKEMARTGKQIWDKPIGLVDNTSLLYMNTPINKYPSGGEMNVFYMCLVNGTGSCRVRHDNYGIARQEAERLARSTGKGVSVLKVVAHCKPASPPIEWEQIDDGSSQKTVARPPGAGGEAGDDDHPAPLWR